MISWLASDTSEGSWAIFSLTCASLEAAFSNDWIVLINSSGSGGASLAECLGERMTWTSFLPSLSNWTTSLHSDFFRSFLIFSASTFCALFSLDVISKASRRQTCLATGSPWFDSCLLLKLVSAVHSDIINIFNK